MTETNGLSIGVINVTLLPQKVWHQLQQQRGLRLHDQQQQILGRGVLPMKLGRVRDDVVELVFGKFQ